MENIHSEMSVEIKQDAICTSCANTNVHTIDEFVSLINTVM